MWARFWVKPHSKTFALVRGKCFFPECVSEGFPFIVGVWGWTGVRVVLVVSSSPRRRRVLISLHCAVHTHTLMTFFLGELV